MSSDVFHRTQAPDAVPGPLSQFRVLAAVLMCAVMAGCVDESSDPVLSVSRFDVWKIPASGVFIPEPRALFSDADDQVYVLDKAGRVLVYDSTGRLIRQWEMPEHSIGKPEGVWRLHDGTIAVADTHYHRVIIFSDDGDVLRMFGTKGSGPGQFVFPVAVAQDDAGFLYVGEYGDRQRIQKFTPEGEFVTMFGEHGTGEGQFQRPSAIACDREEVYVLDAFNDRIQVFDRNGAFLRVITPGAGSDPLQFPYDLKTGPDGLFYIIENKGGRLTVMEKNGTVRGRFGKPSYANDGFNNPWALAVLSDGRVLVADTGNHRLIELTR
ncbi:MAG: hypothetical protein KDA96_14110 [Planctomycetaceae bacterium]|nr:hypothetical protein [Planctomycetaceae bacterium]